MEGRIKVMCGYCSSDFVIDDSKMEQIVSCPHCLRKMKIIRSEEKVEITPVKSKSLEGPTWLEKNSEKKKSLRQEKRWAKELEGKRRPASGALLGLRGDITKGKFLFELKRTDKKSFTLTLEMWNKIMSQSFSDGKIPAVGLTIQGIDLVVISRDTFLALIEKK